MKTKLVLYFSICIASIIILSFAKDENPRVKAERVTISKADSIVTHGGNGRIEITWLVKSDANVHNYKVVWYSAGRRYDTSNIIRGSYGRRVINLMLNEMREGKYIFEIFMYDKDGNSSPKATATGTVYGPEYQSSLVSRTCSKIKKDSNDIILNWTSSRKGMIGVEVKYKNDLQDTVVHFIPASKTVDTIEATAENQYIEYRTLYLPNPTAIDTFYTDYVATHFGSRYKYELHYDDVSNTSYYLTRIYHVDDYGKLVKLRLAHTIRKEGETVREFADRTNSTLAFNASTQVKYQSDRQRANMPSVVAIVNGDIINNAPRSNRYTLGIEDDNELVVFDPGTSAESILNNGVTNAVTAFVPLILNYRPVSDKIINYVGNQRVKHPRQVIAQFDNLDILFLTTGGRGFGGEGMTARDVIRILMDLDNIKFAYNLDGGGSTSTVINGKFINWKMDKNGTEERKRPTFLYIK